MRGGDEHPATLAERGAGGGAEAPADQLDLLPERRDHADAAGDTVPLQTPQQPGDPVGLGGGAGAVGRGQERRVDLVPMTAERPDVRQPLVARGDNA